MGRIHAERLGENGHLIRILGVRPGNDAVPALGRYINGHSHVTAALASQRHGGLHGLRRGELVDVDVGHVAVVVHTGDDEVGEVGGIGLHLVAAHGVVYAFLGGKGAGIHHLVLPLVLNDQEVGRFNDLVCLFRVVRRVVGITADHPVRHEVIVGITALDGRAGARGGNIHPIAAARHLYLAIAFAITRVRYNCAICFCYIVGGVLHQLADGGQGGLAGPAVHLGNRVVDGTVGGETQVNGDVTIGVEPEFRGVVGEGGHGGDVELTLKLLGIAEQVVVILPVADGLGSADDALGRIL